MGILKRLFGKSTEIDVLRLDILMDYDIMFGTGRAAIKWTPINEEAPQFAAMLIGALYGRILAIHPETRTRLYATIDVLSSEVINHNGSAHFYFPEWALKLGKSGNDHIWPWKIVSTPPALSKPKTYSAYLIGDLKSRTMRLHLDMAFGYERILAPASILIAISHYSSSANDRQRHALAQILTEINRQLHSLENISVKSAHTAWVKAVSTLEPNQL